MADFKAMSQAGLQAAKETMAVTADAGAADEIRVKLEALMPRIADASIRKLPPEFIVSTALTLLRSNPKLRECTPLSVVHGILQAAQLGLRLDPSLGHATLVPRKNRRTGEYEAQFMPMYKGLLLRAQRTGKVREVVTQAVYDGDTFRYSYGMNANFVHTAGKRETNSQITHFYAYARLVNGGFQFEVMSVDEVKQARDRGGYRAGSGGSPWDTDFVAMGRKTVLKRLLQLLPVEDTILADAVRLDNMAEQGIVQSISVDDAGRLVSADYTPVVEEDVPVAVEEDAACSCNDMSKLGEPCDVHGDKTRTVADKLAAELGAVQVQDVPDGVQPIDYEGRVAGKTQAQWYEACMADVGRMKSREEAKLQYTNMVKMVADGMITSEMLDNIGKEIKKHLEKIDGKKKSPRPTKKA